MVTIESFAKILGEVTLMRPGFGKPPIDILKITEGEITRALDEKLQRRGKFKEKFKFLYRGGCNT